MGDTGFTYLIQGSYFNAPTEGNYQAIFGPVDGYGGIAQTISARAGRFVIKFDMGQEEGEGNFVKFGGQTILADIADNGGAWTSYSFTVTTGANPVLEFQFTNPPSYYVLDNVSVTASGAIPEPQSWALMIAGFGLVGAAARRRRTVVA